MIGDHPRAIVEFSGGADSTALLYLARPFLDRITVLFVDPGATFLHVREHIEETCDRLGARLEIVRPHVPVQEWHRARGLPADIVPGWHTAEEAWTMERPPAVLVQPTHTCCLAMLWLPKARWTIASGIKLVLRGTKRADERRGVPPGTVDEHGIEYRFPLWDWSDADVLTYLRREGVTLPRHYEHVKDSLDCTLCTGHTGAHYARARYRYIRDHHPDVWAELEPRVAAVRDVIESEARRHGAAMAVDGEV